jgi:hypothetical protein
MSPTTIVVDAILYVSFYCSIRQAYSLSKFRHGWVRISTIPADTGLTKATSTLIDSTPGLVKAWTTFCKPGPFPQAKIVVIDEQNNQATTTTLGIPPLWFMTRMGAVCTTPSKNIATSMMNPNYRFVLGPSIFGLGLLPFLKGRNRPL